MANASRSKSESAGPEAKLSKPSAEPSATDGRCAPPGDGPRIFRRRAMMAHAAGDSEAGNPLRLSPRWASWCYRLVVSSVAAALLFGTFGTLRDYASGPAVVRLPGLQDVTAVENGIVSSVHAVPGQEVKRGQILVTFHGAPEQANLEQIEREFELQLLARLRDPRDQAAEEALIHLRSQRELARARLAQRAVRSPAAGIVSDVRVRPGQLVTPGQALLTVATGREEPFLLALLPGRYRPQLEAGMPLQLEIDGYEEFRARLVISHVGAEVVGPAEARRYLGPELSDAIPLEGTVVPVKADLGSFTFKAGGRIYAYHDGMRAHVEVPVRSEPIFQALFPGLRALLGGRGV